MYVEDVGQLLTVLHRPVGQGNTVVVQRDLDVTKTADRTADTGPEAAITTEP